MQLSGVEFLLSTLDRLFAENSIDKVDFRDRKFAESTTRQFSKKVGLTEKQTKLAKSILSRYKKYFNDDIFSNNISFNHFEYRVISTESYVKFVNIDSAPVTKLLRETSKDKSLKYYISIRFSFSSKLIKKLKNVKRKIRNKFNDQFRPMISYNLCYCRDTKTHFILATPDHIMLVVEEFKGSIEIASDVLAEYDRFVSMITEAEVNIPRVTVNGFVNCHPSLEKHLTETLGHPSSDNIVHYRDRKTMYKIEISDDIPSTSNVSALTSKIVDRTNNIIHIQNDDYQLSDVARSFVELNRFPVLIVLDRDVTKSISTISSAFMPWVALENSVVSFREHNQHPTPHAFNTFIKKRGFNNKVDSNTKIVYCNASKLKKLAVDLDISYAAVLVDGSRGLPSTINCITSTTDLTVHYGEYPTIWRNLNIELISGINANLQTDNIR